MLDDLKNKYPGQTITIVGKGCSLQYLKKEHFVPGPVITINEAILTVESLELANPIYSMQKDGGDRKKSSTNNLSADCDYSNDCSSECRAMRRPKKATLLLHEMESKYCFPDYSDRYVFDLKELGLPGNECSIICAIQFGKFMGCNGFRFISFDAHVTGDTQIYVPGKQETVKKGDYESQIPKIKQYVDGYNVEWIIPEQKIAFGCMINDMKRFDLILKGSNIEGCQCFTIFDPDTATKGLNTLLDIIDKSGAEIGILTHQDMYYKQHWLPQVREQLKKLPEDWVIAGIVGKDEKGILCGRFHDMSSPLWIISEHEFPVRCSCIDECTIIVNMKSGFRFEEELIGFDLYGTYACLRANEMGSAWIIDAWAEHYCSRFWNSWEPDKTFMKMWKWIYNRFPGKRLESTVLVGEDQ